MTHGLDCLELDAAQKDLFRKHAIRQLRILSKAPVFITREPYEALLSRLKLPDPVTFVLDKLRRRVEANLAGPKTALQPATATVQQR